MTNPFMHSSCETAILHIFVHFFDERKRKINHSHKFIMQMQTIYNVNLPQVISVDLINFLPAKSAVRHNRRIFFRNQSKVMELHCKSCVQNNSHHIGQTLYIGS